ncbi:unnamed protein product [Musa hybrid cultivar]
MNQIMPFFFVVDIIHPLSIVIKFTGCLNLLSPGTREDAAHQLHQGKWSMNPSTCELIGGAAASFPSPL